MAKVPYSVGIADVVDEYLNTLNSLLTDYYIKLSKKALKSRRNPFSITKAFTKNSKATYYTDKLMLKLNKDILKIMEEHLNKLESYGADVSTSIFYGDIRKLNEIYLGNINDELALKLQQTYGTYLFEGDNKLVLDALANVIGKSVGEVKRAMREVNVTYARKVTDNAFKQIEQEFGKENIRYRYTGVLDSKNTPFCRSHVGKVHTRAEWEKIKFDIFVRGGHFGCRHSLELMPPKKVKHD